MDFFVTYKGGEISLEGYAIICNLQGLQIQGVSSIQMIAANRLQSGVFTVHPPFKKVLNLILAEIQDLSPIWKGHCGSTQSYLIIN